MEREIQKVFFFIMLFFVTIINNAEQIFTEKVFEGRTIPLF